VELDKNEKLPFDHRTSYVYAIKNKLNGLMYIGSTVDPKLRWESHRICLRCGTHNKKLQEAWDKFGEDVFEFVIIEENIPILHQFIAEQYWLDTLKTYEEGKGYNVQPRAGSYVPFTEHNRQAEAIEHINEMLDGIKKRVPYRVLVERYNVSKGFLTKLKIRYLPELIILEKNKREQNGKKQLNRIFEIQERAQLEDKILNMLATGKKYRDISKELGVSLGTIERAFRLGPQEVKFKRWYCSIKGLRMNVQQH
jgi:group I intron endonuclease